ncbi:MAG: hypothetical protein KF872_10200 [Chitinophagales bacterium]|nr:hypothetical protein [Chitinophagales bacterium]
MIAKRKLFIAGFLSVAFSVCGMRSVLAQQTVESKFVMKVGEDGKAVAHPYFPAFMKYPVTEKRPELKETGNKDWDITVYNNELQHWYYLYDKKGYTQKYGALPDLAGKKMPEPNVPIFDSATAPMEYRNPKTKQK